MLFQKFLNGGEFLARSKKKLRQIIYFRSIMPASNLNNEEILKYSSSKILPLFRNTLRRSSTVGQYENAIPNMAEKKGRKKKKNPNAIFFVAQKARMKGQRFCLKMRLWNSL